MKPLTLTLSNFGPFLNETIDFKQVFENQLFLISGKTGSGKTMIFDGIVYALLVHLRRVELKAICEVILLRLRNL